ncbi:retrovirus-related pol polyprotein from transposon TNT 1-94 [Tanacetum coccineum]
MVWTLVPVPYVAQGFRQEEGIDYDETLIPVAILEAIRVFLAYVVYMGFMVYQMDEKSAFLNGKISKELYVQQPPRFESSEFPIYVCKLDKALYGLKHAPKAWYEIMSTFLIQHKFVRGTINNTLFTYKTKSDVIIVQIYVDDIIFGSTGDKLSKQFAKLMTKKYEINLLKKYDLADNALVKCPMLPLNNLGPDESGVFVNETLFRGMIRSLSAKKQSSVAISSAEVEYVAAPGCYAQVLWIKSQLTDYDVLYDKVPIFYDNTSVIAISNNLVLHSMTKHIDIKYNFTRDHILKGDIELHFVPTNMQLADIFTKPLAEPSFTRLVAELGMLNIEKEVPDKKKALSDLLT